MPTLTRGAYALPSTTLGYHTGTWRVQKPQHNHGGAPCHLACPAGEDAQAWLAELDMGHTEAAWRILTQANPMPAITGRVCHHPCESACNRGQYDQPIAIHHVERHIGDEAIRNGWQFSLPPVRFNRSIAVIGAGPAGLSCAYHLRQHGYEVVIYDELPVAGGTLHTSLPAYRLPRDVLAAEVDRILAIEGISFRPQQRLGRDMSLDELKQQHSAIFLAVGRQASRAWSVDGVVPRDLASGIEILQEWVALGTLPPLKSAAIIGGGNTAIDMARILIRAGISDVHVITHNALPGEGAIDVMPAIPREIKQALEEGVQIHPQRGIRRLLLRGERVVGVEMVRTKRVARQGGKSEMVTFTGTETVLHVDHVIPAIGQDVDRSGVAALLASSGLFATNSWGEIGHTGILSGGDAREGSSGTVSGAIGDGRRAAMAIIAYLEGVSLPEQEPRRKEIPFSHINTHYYQKAERHHAGILPVAERSGEREVELGLSAQSARSEARRCFSCGNCLACDNCWTLCPDSAVYKTEVKAIDGSHYLFDYDYCKGCGLCATECPCGFIEMVEDL
jgi:formate dehydrogenase (NADP+) beta subunit